MRLRRRKPSTNTGRRQRRPAESTPEAAAGSLAYRQRRTDDNPNVGRKLPRSSARSPKDMSQFIFKRFGLIILFVALLISVVNMLSVSGHARVMPLSGSNDAFLHDQAAYEDAADKLLADSVWNRNKITIDTGAVSRGMLQQFPELSSVSVTLPLFSKRPIVYIQTTQPALTLAARDGSFIIGANGKALLRADQLPSTNKLSIPQVNDQSGLEVKVNQQALSSVDVSFIQTVVGQLAARHFTVASMVLPAGASELDVKLDGQPYTVKFNLESGDARQQAGTFLATQSKLASQHITPAEYIDVRVDGRAYYK